MPDPITALIVGGTSLAGGALQAHAAGNAADVQSAASSAGIAEQRRQFDAMRELLKPYTEAGMPALAGQQALLGLSGADAQKQAIDAISNGSQMQELQKQGENSMLQNASATGGLRGGNLQGALAQFRPQLLNQLINEQYSKLGGLAAMGQNSAAGVGSAGMQTGSNIANLLQQSGAAQAGGILGQAKGYGQILNLPMQLLGMQMGNGSPIGIKGAF